MKYSSKSLFSSFDLGYAVLPNLSYYNEEFKTDEPIELVDDEIILLYTYGTRSFLSFLQGDCNAHVTTLSRKGFEKYKDNLWHRVDKYQSQNKTRYRNKTSKTKLVHEDFINLINKEYEKIEDCTLQQYFKAQEKVAGLKNIIEKYNLDYKSYLEKKRVVPG